MNGPGTDVSFKGVVIFIAALFLASTAHAEVDTGGLKLVDASGVPDGAIHSYMFQGSIVFYPTAKSGEFVSPYENFWGDGKGSWNQGSKEAEERFRFSGSLAGELKVLFKCQKDPWLTTNAGCVFISTQYSGTSGKVYDWNLILKTRGRPLSTGAVTLAAATELSKNHVASGAPPPPPPKSQPKRDPLKIGDSLGAPGGLKAAPATAAAFAQPKLGVTAVQTKVDPSCQKITQLLTAAVSIRNTGGPLPAGKGTVFVKETGGANFSSQGVNLPEFKMNETRIVEIPAGVIPQFAGALPGSHVIAVHLNPQIDGGKSSFDKPSPPFQFTVNIPAGLCQPRTPAAAGQRPGGQAAPATRMPAQPPQFPPNPVQPRLPR